MKLTMKIHEATIISMNDNRVMNSNMKNNDHLGLGTKHIHKI